MCRARWQAIDLLDMTIKPMRLGDKILYDLRVSNDRADYKEKVSNKK